MGLRRPRLFLFCIALSAASAAFAVSQDADSPGAPGPAASDAPADPSAYLGATIAQLAATLGLPRSVKASRGPEAWQDDVVFVYDDCELYLYRDRVWQVRSGAAYGLRVGDGRDAVLAALGEPFQRYEADFVYQRPSRAWPIRLRLRFGEDGAVSDLFVYRADF